jgi:hypothetical protein
VRQHLLWRFRSLGYLVELLFPRTLTVQIGTCLWELTAKSSVLSVNFLFVVAVNVLLVNNLTQLLFVTTKGSG